jgi:hypothetical protein
MAVAPRRRAIGEDLTVAVYPAFIVVHYVVAVAQNHFALAVLALSVTAIEPRGSMAGGHDSRFDDFHLRSPQGRFLTALLQYALSDELDLLNQVPRCACFFDNLKQLACILSRKPIALAELVQSVNRPVLHFTGHYTVCQVFQMCARYAQVQTHKYFLC